MSIGAVVAAFACLLPLWFGAVGLTCRYIIGAVANLASRWWGNPRPAVVRADANMIRELIIIGFPNMLSSQLSGLFNVADRSVIWVRLSETDLGMFQLASLVATGLQVLPATLGLILLPRVARRYGETGDPASLRRFVWQGVGLGFALLVPAVGFFYFAMDPLTRGYFPKYIGGVRAAEITCLSMLTFAATGVGAVITTLRGNVAMMLIVGAGLAVVWIGGWAAVSAGAGIAGVAWVRLIAQCWYAFGMVALALILTRSEPARSANRSETVS